MVGICHWLKKERKRVGIKEEGEGKVEKEKKEEILEFKLATTLVIIVGTMLFTS